MNFNETDEFKKDLKRLLKKYKSLLEDLRNFKKVTSKIPLGAGKHFVVLTSIETMKVVKARFFCRCLRGSSLRVIYAYYEQEQIIEFIELYFKGDKEKEDGNRIKEYLKLLS